MGKELDIEIDITKFVNIDDKKFVFYVSKQPREVEAGEEKVMPVYVAQLGAKHLVDRILQEKHNVKDTNTDSSLRQSLFAQILPEMAEDRGIKPLSEEDFKKSLKEQLDKQNKLIEGISGKSEKREEKMEKLEKEIAELKEKLSRRGRPPKEEVEEETQSS